MNRLKEILTNEPEKSVGVITFNINQKALVNDLIDRCRIEDPEFEEAWSHNLTLDKDSQVFVKNIENVQGDERDIIIFSVGYAPSAPGGRVSQLFGSLNKEGGENRLNVAVTRARHRIEVICSINPSTDLDTSGSKNRGPKLLQAYLEYAYAVSQRDHEKVHQILEDINPNTQRKKGPKVNQFDSPFEEEVFQQLCAFGFSVDSQVGQSGFKIDLAIIHPKDPSRYILGIECDGAGYHSSISARERDVFRQRFLEGQGWKIHRVWSSKWWSNPYIEALKIRSEVEKLLHRDEVNSSMSNADIKTAASGSNLTEADISQPHEILKRVEATFAATDHRVHDSADQKSSIEITKSLYLNILDWNAKFKKMTNTPEQIGLRAIGDHVALTEQRKPIPDDTRKRAQWAVERAIFLGFDPKKVTDTRIA